MSVVSAALSREPGRRVQIARLDKNEEEKLEPHYQEGASYTLFHLLNSTCAT